MKFNEKLLSIRKKQGLSQEELGMELEVSRQTISKWEAGQSYPDFQRLVMLSDYFNMTLDELVKDVDFQDVREKNLTDEKVSSIFRDVQYGKETLSNIWRIACIFGIIILLLVCAGFIAHLLFPNIEWLWVTK
ncbi:helix-turn-helix domain-containing protein [Anaerorhabdus sp.]|uniref:helix-turn-helix domain-containing protein n=1 Tax=Anaerorhabdus sp. TaxID=1872524 RepID=UPI002FC73C82